MEGEGGKERERERERDGEGEGEGEGVVEVRVEVCNEFELEKAVCSHGLFMMSPNYWHSPSNTLYRPLYIPSSPHNHNNNNILVVSISQPKSSSLLRLLVYGTHSLSPLQHSQLLTQVKRMLRLSEVEETNVKEFQKMHKGAKEKGFGRMFRSPTLFEDMVKCMLLCNCQWPRTLSMARALCELQWELNYRPTCQPFVKVLHGTSSINVTIEDTSFFPDTPEGKELKRKFPPRKYLSKLSASFGKAKAEINADVIKITGGVVVSNSLQETEKLCHSSRKDDSSDLCNSCQTSAIVSEAHSSEGLEHFSHNKIGNFPSPEEIANLDKDFLAKRCGLGYRANRILDLARSIVKGNIQLGKFEESCREPNLLDYSQLAEQLKEINGFGPYTCSNVLMCMGFYHVVPSDSETIRHLNQVHKIGSTIKSVQRDVEIVYGNYAPFQFLAYWWEVWEFYIERFGKLSEMPPADYKLITASKMKPAKRVTGKRTKSADEMKLQRNVKVTRIKILT